MNQVILFNPFILLKLRLSYQIILVATVSINEINRLISQNNYLGLYVQVIGEHICSLDKKLDNLTNLIIQIDDKLKLANQVSSKVSTSQATMSLFKDLLRFKILFLDLFMILKAF
ncbi:hypothetical protein H5410_012379 [Solanum commersonii]|uniref:Uncharacterized protein n=1 Tax=Solanum commersonii TaxID=4109 RepID=A0A9J6AS73_SOLCO|nr:hypothetical protein H5410_012379 [Solanum commersonii]